MKTLERRLQEAAKKKGVIQRIVEVDYAQSYVLHGISSVPELRDALVFKGGTALKKVHFESYRFSEDLDFSAENSPKEGVLDRVIRAAVRSAEMAARAFAPVAFQVERYMERDPHPGGQEAFTVRVQYPWQRQPLVPVKIEITQDEPVLLSAHRLPVRHGYEEPLDVAVRTYRLEEICAEKLRSTRQTRRSSRRAAGCDRAGATSSICGIL